MSSAESAAADALPLPASPGSDPAGFWLGLLQGFISPITFLISLFTSAVNIYEVQNNGNWYDFGFMLGVAAAFGGGAAVAHQLVGFAVGGERPTARSAPSGTSASRELHSMRQMCAPLLMASARVPASATAVTCTSTDCRDRCACALLTCLVQRT